MEIRGWVQGRTKAVASRWKFVGASLARLRNKWKPRAAREVSDEKNSKK